MNSECGTAHIPACAPLIVYEPYKASPPGRTEEREHHREKGVPHRAGMSKAQSIDSVHPGLFIEALSSHRPGSFSTTGAAVSAGRSKALSASMMMTGICAAASAYAMPPLPVGAFVGGQGTSPSSSNALTASQMSNAASFGPSWDFDANGTCVMPAGGTHPVLPWQVAH